MDAGNIQYLCELLSTLGETLVALTVVLMIQNVWFVTASQHILVWLT